MKQSRRQYWVLVLAGLLTATGCVEVKDDYTLNPDGSGRVKHEAVFAAMDLNLNGSDKKSDPAEELKTAVRKELEKAEGIDAWRDVTWSRGDDGRIRFAGTAYFRDLNKVKFHNNGFKTTMFKPHWADSALTLTTDRETEAKPRPVPANEEEMNQALAKSKAQYQQMKPMLASMFAGMKMDMAFRLPGPVTEQSNFKTAANGVLQVGYTGEQFIQLLDESMTNDDFLRTQIQAGRDPMKSGPENELWLNEKLLGAAKPVRAAVAPGGKPLFDYDAEVTAAKAQMPAIYSQLGAVPPTPVAPAGSAELKSIKVGGVRWIRFTDDDREIRPFNWSEGYTISVVAELPGSVMKVAEGKLTKAETDTGEDLLLERDYDRKIQFPKLSKDKTAAIFDLKLKSPSDTATGFKEISGTITYLVGEKTAVTDLGFDGLTVDATGSKLGAKIKGIEPIKWKKGWTEIEVKLETRAEMIKQLQLRNADNTVVESEPGGRSQIGDRTTFTLRVKGEVPANGKLEVEMYEDLKEFEAPFRLQNITLLGQPMK